MFAGGLAVEVAVPRLDGAFGGGQAVLLLAPRSAAHSAGGGVGGWRLLLRWRWRTVLRGLLLLLLLPRRLLLEVLLGPAGIVVDGVVDAVPVVLDDVVDSFCSEFDEALGHLMAERRPRASCATGADG